MITVTEHYAGTSSLSFNAFQSSTNTILLCSTIPLCSTTQGITPPTLEQHGGYKAQEGKKSPRGSGNSKTRRTLDLQSGCLPLLPQRSSFTLSNKVRSRHTNRWICLSILIKQIQ